MQMTLSSADLMDEAGAQTGLQEWGDRSFTGALDLLLSSCQETAALSEVGWRALRKNVMRCLRNRLYLEAYVEAHPEVTCQGLAAPVIVTGLPRTGTTLLHNLLALDPANRPLRFWEALRPVPPDPSNGFSQDSLVEEAEAWLERLYERAPSFRSVHASTAHTPEECDVLFENAFASWHFEIAFPAGAYSDWLGTAHLGTEYSYYVRQLQALTTGGDPTLRWVLKSPSHLGHLDALMKALPQATIVHCHRDPLVSIASFASLVLSVRTPYCEEVRPEAVGREWLGRFSQAMAKALHSRQAAESAGVIDVSYRDLVADPTGTVRALYQRLGLSFEGRLEARVQRWLAENPKHKHGVHSYDLAQFGLTDDDVSAAFASYRQRFATAIVG